MQQTAQELIVAVSRIDTKGIVDLILENYKKKENKFISKKILRTISTYILFA